MKTEHKTTLIIGATAVGKSDYAIQLAKQTNGEIISADAYQVYRGMDIGTAKVSKNSLKEVPHHLIDIKNPDEPYSVAQFCWQTNDIISTLHKQQKPAIICGGTGLYLKAFLNNYEFPKTVNNDYKKALEQDAQDKETDYLWQKLHTIDPDAASKIPKENHQRLIRQLELYHQTGTKPSDLNTHTTQRTDVTIIGIDYPREMIYERINKRVDIMIENGLIDEVKTLTSQYPKECLAFQALGYKETIAYLEGTINKEDMVELIKRKTRNFAKRQLTWYRRFENVQWITPK